VEIRNAIKQLCNKGRTTKINKGIGLTDKKIDTEYLKALFLEYAQWNEFREDGLIIHTDCLDDFLEWLDKMPH
jgi:hypothetical protein